MSSEVCDAALLISGVMLVCDLDEHHSSKHRLIASDGDIQHISAEHAALLSELDKRDELRPYMQHKGTCFIYPCTCGLSELLKRLPD